MVENKKPDYIEHEFLQKNTVIRRSYQQKIFASCIGKNSLVVLPTSMGKTIIALMLSLFHLSEDIDNKILFLAPTKPLVVQHQRSFINMTIFGEDEWQLPVLTGSINPKKREKIYLDAKIAFMTPQVLQNDVISNRINLKEVALIIFDEAHRAVGDYAYTFIAEVFSQQNPNGQILAMSASPGGDKAKIEEVCKNLHVENIEIRSHDSPDVKPYVQDVDVNWIKLEMPDEYIRPKKELEELLKQFYRKLYDNDVLENYGLSSVSRKDLLAGSKKIDFLIRKQRSDDDLARLFAMKKIISNAIRVSHMLELLEAQGVEPLHDYFKKNIAEVRNPKSSKSLRELFTMNSIRNAMQSIKSLIDSNFIHPKLEKLGELVDSQFEKNSESRILVFANFRDSIDSILKYFENFPRIRPQRFVGQQNKKSGKKIIKGMSQKEQIAVLEEFKEGKFNTLIATSVAEEGLDIAECDMVIFYDVVPSEIRTIQRRGRTGRKSSGSVYILMTKGTREEGYYWAARRREKEMKKNLKQLSRGAKKIIDSKAEHTKIHARNSISNNPGQIIDENHQKSLSEFINHAPKAVSKNNSKNSASSPKKSEVKKELHGLDNFIRQKATIVNVKEKTDITNLKNEEFIPAEKFGGKSQGFHVIVDTRETQGAVVRHLALKGTDLILKNLPVADYILSDHIGIERKEAVDFNQSLTDGRLFDELYNLKLNFETPILIIEGDPIGATGISRDAILGAMASIIVNMKITTLTTNNAQETAEMIMAMIKKDQQKRNSKAKIFKKKTNTFADAQEQMISGIPGVNLFRAQELLTSFSNVKNIINADEEELSGISGIGTSTAKKIKKIAEFDYNSREK